MGRGASPSANPCSFVRKHHVCRAGWAAGGWDVVLHCPQALILRPEAPRLSGRMGLRRLGRGTSPPASPCSFVRKHHVYRAGWASGGWNVVLHCPQTLVPSSGGTTSVGPDGPPAAEAWCFTARKPLFLVRRHHVCQSGWDEVGNGTAVSLPLHT